MLGAGGFGNAIRASVIITVGAVAGQTIPRSCPAMRSVSWASWVGLILVHIGMGVPFGMFWMRARFRAIPISLSGSIKE